MKRMVRHLVAVLLIVSVLTGMLPAEVIGEKLGILYARAAAEAEQSSAAAAVIDANSDRFATCAEQARGITDVRQEGEWRYVVLPDTGYAVIVGHTDQGSARVDLPAVLGGADVVAVLGGTFAGHTALREVTFSANVYYADKDALPRGVSVRGYWGSYAQRWAADNRRSFENLSEWDFVAGVVDFSDIDQANFTRHSAEQVTLRELEASRLQEGSVFFLMDPANQYAISFYEVKEISV